MLQLSPNAAKYIFNQKRKKILLIQIMHLKNKLRKYCYYYHIGHRQLNGHEFVQTPGDSEGQESLAHCSPWGHKESNTTERQQPP